MFDIDVKLLRVFCTIVDCGGFSAAQAHLNTSASRISTQMSTLETRLGMRLCQRGRTGFAITEDGRAVYDEAKKLFASLDDFRLALGERQKNLSGEIRIGLIDNMVFNPGYRLPEAIARFREQTDQVRLDLKILSPTELEAGLLEGMLHVAIGYFHHRVEGLDYEPLFTETHSLYCGRGHPLFETPQRKVSLGDLQDYDYVNRRYIDKEGELVSTIPMRGSAETENMEALAVLILSGVYIAYLPTNYAQHWVDKGEMRALRPKELRQKASLHMATRRGVRPPAALQAFLTELRRCQQNIDESEI